MQTSLGSAEHNSTRVVVIGGSAGGLVALGELLEYLPSNFPAIIVAVLHRGVYAPTNLQAILARHAHLPVMIPKDGDLLQSGICYIGYPDRHIAIGAGFRARLIEDGFYRSNNIDALFVSAARHAGPKVIGVVLSGMRKDGAEGLVAIKEMGGVTLVQKPEEAEYAEMPRSAILQDGRTDFIGSVRQLAEELCRLMGVPQKIAV